MGSECITQKMASNYLNYDSGMFSLKSFRGEDLGIFKDSTVMAKHYIFVSHVSWRKEMEAYSGRSILLS